MDKDTIYRHVPVFLMCVAIIFQYNLFVTPEQLEHKHREIMSEISQIYNTKSEFGNLKEQIADINKKVDKIYDRLIKERSLNVINQD